MPWGHGRHAFSGAAARNCLALFAASLEGETALAMFRDAITTASALTSPPVSGRSRLTTTTYARPDNTIFATRLAPQQQSTAPVPSCPTTRVYGGRPTRRVDNGARIPHDTAASSRLHPRPPRGERGR